MELNHRLQHVGLVSFRWTTGPQIAEVGVEPTKSPGSRPGRFSSLRTRPVARVGFEPTESRMFELRRFSRLRTVPAAREERRIEPLRREQRSFLLVVSDPFSQASPSSSGGIRTHSIPGSKPRWSASCLPSLICRLKNGDRHLPVHQISRFARFPEPVPIFQPAPIECPRRESNPQTLRFK